MTDNNIKLSPRLLTAAALIRKGAFICDVGTDHAYLPIFLCLEGQARGGIVSDINEGPIERANENIEKYGLCSRLTAKKADGLCGMEQYAPEDITVLGMGGELIARIIEDAPWTKNSSIHLCLQPMTHPEKLREFLAENGYAIIDERLAREDDRIYQIILAQYSGEKTQYSAEELLLGRINISRGGELISALATRHIEVLERRARGIESGGKEASEIHALIDKIKNIL